MTELAPINETASIHGEVYEDVNGKRFVAVPSNGEAQQQIVSMRRRMIDLPDVPQRMNTISVVLSYELFGLNHDDIATAVGLSPEQVGTVQMLDAYRDMRDAVIESIHETDVDNVRSVFMAKAQRSAERIVELADSARPDIALMASREVLDRSGNTVKEIVEHRVKLEGGLVIEHITRDNSQQVPTIDLKPVEVKKE